VRVIVTVKTLVPTGVCDCCAVAFGAEGISGCRNFLHEKIIIAIIISAGIKYFFIYAASFSSF
jgi:hypothetical protein